MGAAIAWQAETATDPFADTRAAFERLLPVARSEETQRMKHSDLERLLAKEGQELMRQLYQDCVDEQAQAEVADEVVDAQGRQRTRKRQQHRVRIPVNLSSESGGTLPLPTRQASSRCWLEVVSLVLPRGVG